MASTTWFRHDVNASADINIQHLNRKYGFAGVGIYWSLVEALYKNDGTMALASLDDFAFAMHGDASTIRQIVLESGLFKHDEESFWSDRILEELNRVQSLSDTRRKAVNSRWGKDKNSHENTDEETGKIQTNNNSNTNVIHEKKFVIPYERTNVRDEERDCSDSLHSSSLPPDDAQNAASPDGGATPQQPDLGLGDEQRQQDQSKPKPAVFLTFPRIGKPPTHDVTEDDVTAWAALFPAIDVRQALRNALAWLNANPRNGKTNIPRFLTSWLTREQDKAGPQRPGAQPYRRVASDRTPGYDLGRTHVFDNTRPGGEVRT